jgi:hypothetical protein
VADPFSTWWVSEFGHPPLPGQSEMMEKCRKAFEAGRDNPNGISFTEKKEHISEVNEDAILFDGYEGALVGYSIRFGREAIAIYDYDKCLDILMTKGEGDFEEGMSYENALDWFCYNTLGCWAGEHTPAFIKRFESL